MATTRPSGTPAARLERRCAASSGEVTRLAVVTFVVHDIDASPSLRCQGMDVCVCVRVRT